MCTVIAEKSHWWWGVGRTHIAKGNKESKGEQLLSVYYAVVLGRKYINVVEDGRHFIDRAYPAETPPCRPRPIVPKTSHSIEVHLIESVYKSYLLRMMPFLHDYIVM